MDPNSYSEILMPLKKKKVDVLKKIYEKGFTKENALTEISKYLSACSFEFRIDKSLDISERIYNDLFEKSILTGPLKNIWVQKIFIKSWDSVIVQFINGQISKIGQFPSQEDAVSVVQTILQESKLPVDQPIIEGSLLTGAKITVLFQPVVSKETALTCTIVKAKRRTFSDQDYISNNFAERYELDFLLSILRNKSSLLVTGSHGSGKTAFMEYLVSKFPDDAAFSIEQGRREISTGISMMADGKKNLSDYIKAACSMDPDILAINADWYGQGAALQGVPTIFSVVAGNPYNAVNVSALAWHVRQPKLAFTTCLELTCTAFPVIVTLRLFADGVRRISEISECGYSSGQVKISPLWRYDGGHKKVGELSAKVKNHEFEEGEKSC